MVAHVTLLAIESHISNQAKLLADKVEQFLPHLSHAGYIINFERTNQNTKMKKAGEQETRKKKIADLKLNLK